MAIACVLRPYGAFCAAAQGAHDFVIGWMSHSIPPPWQAMPRHARPCHTLPALPPPSLGPARRSAPHCSRRLRTFSIMVSGPARNDAASVSAFGGIADHARTCRWPNPVANDDRCCRKSLFALLMTNSPSRRRGDINVWCRHYKATNSPVTSVTGLGHIDEQSVA
jgi:hypothetical protein